MAMNFHKRLRNRLGKCIIDFARTSRWRPQNSQANLAPARLRIRQRRMTAVTVLLRPPIKVVEFANFSTACLMTSLCNAITELIAEELKQLCPDSLHYPQTLENCLWLNEKTTERQSFLHGRLKCSKTRLAKKCNVLLSNCTLDTSATLQSLVNEPSSISGLGQAWTRDLYNTKATLFSPIWRDLKMIYGRLLLSRTCFAASTVHGEKR